MTEFYKLPRLFMDLPMQAGGLVPLADGPFHYLKNVMRLEQGAQVRLFNGSEGEFVGTIVKLGKKDGEIQLGEKLKEQPATIRRVHLLFAPIRKERMDWLVEKAVELGATDLHPVFTQNTDNRKINPDKICLQMIEAAEQCERLDIPTLHSAQDIFKTLAAWNKAIPVLAALERQDTKSLSATLHAQGDIAFLIGPSGGFTMEEKEKLSSLPFVTPINLGERILRSETAAAVVLSSLLA